MESLLGRDSRDYQAMHALTTREGHMHRIRIADGGALRAVLREICELHGSHRKAAAWIGIGQSTFTRLLNGVTAETMSFDTYAKIRRTLQSHDPAPIDALNPDEPYRGLLGRFELSVLDRDAWAARGSYEVWLGREYSRLSKKAHAIVNELWDHARFNWDLSKFLQEVTGRSEMPQDSQKRVWLALYRAVEPLCDAEATMGVERSWHEMEEEHELRRYLTHALNREKIVLNRERDLDRFRAVAAREEYKAQVAALEERDIDEWDLDYDADDPAARWPLIFEDEDDESSEGASPEVAPTDAEKDGGSATPGKDLGDFDGTAD